MILLKEKEKTTFECLKADLSHYKIQKPDFSTRTGREFLTFMLQSAIKKFISIDKGLEESLILEMKPDFIDRLMDRLLHNPTKKILVGITGESASGKTFFINRLKELISELSLPISLISSDNYFNDISEQIKIYGSFDLLRESGYDVDSPTSFQLDLLREDLQKISEGETVFIPKYEVNGSGISVPNAIEVCPEKIIVVEGMATLYDEVRDIFDIKIYLETSEKVRKKRFLNRAVSRMQDDENAKLHWNYVKKAGSVYVKPLRQYADITMNGEVSLEYFASVIGYFHNTINFS